jgi:hypothetical protein
MAKRLAIPSKELQLYVVGPKAGFKASRVQRLSLNTDIPSTTIDELGNSSHVGDVKDTPNVTLTFSALDVGIKIFSALTGTSATAYPALGVDAVNLGQLDAIIYVKSDTVSDYVKSAHARKLQIRDYTFSYTVDGESTEDYTAVGSTKRWFSKDVVLDPFTTGTSFTLTQTPIVLKNGNYALSVIVDGAYLDEVSTAPAAGAGTYRLNGVNNKTLTLGDAAVSQVLVVYQADPAGSNWTDVADVLLPAAIRGKDATVTIAANAIKRIQSVTINGTLNVQPVRELGNREIIGYQRQVPEVTGTITVMDTDVELISLLQYGVVASGTEYAPGEGCLTGTSIELKVELLDPCDTTAPYTVLKTVYLDNIGIVGDSYTSNVNQNATQTFNFKSLTGHCVVYSGAK